MISGNIHEKSNLAVLPEPLQRAVQFLKDNDLAAHEPGKFELDGDKMILQVLDQTTGPVGVVQLVAQETQRGGLEIFLSLAVIISINLGLMNLLPIPALDGGRIVCLLITVAVEAITKKKINPKYEGYLHGAGMILLLALMAIIMFKDVIFLFKR